MKLDHRQTPWTKDRCRHGSRCRWTFSGWTWTMSPWIQSHNSIGGCVNLKVNLVSVAIIEPGDSTLRGKFDRNRLSCESRGERCERVSKLSSSHGCHAFEESFVRSSIHKLSPFKLPRLACCHLPRLRIRAKCSRGRLGLVTNVQRIYIDRVVR